MKKDSEKSTPFTSPKKNNPHAQGGDYVQKGKGGKNSKKGKKEAW